MFAALLIIISCLFIIISNSVEGNNFLARSQAGDQKANSSDVEGIRWAILVAGSNEFWNYRHQADVCHAYQILKRGGLREENIIVFMYDDIAYHEENPRKGVIINRPDGENVYEGVPKDYTGRNATVNNFYAAILGDKGAIKGGSGKVLETGPNDHIFIYFADHGGPAAVGMPNNEYVYAGDLMDVLEKKAAAKGYKSLVFYMEACESASMFKEELVQKLNIYATTSASRAESSYGCYCPGDKQHPHPELNTCLGDYYSVAWMEDTEVENRHIETLHQQYELVKKRVKKSHVVEFGNKTFGQNHLDEFMGADPTRAHQTSVHLDSVFEPLNVMEQKDADLLYFKRKVQMADDNSDAQVKAQRDLDEYLGHRSHVDSSVKLIGRILFGAREGERILTAHRSPNQPLVDDWSCLKSMKSAFEASCGSLHDYGMKHLRAFANICNSNIGVEKVAEISAKVCPTFPSNRFSSLSWVAHECVEGVMIFKKCIIHPELNNPTT